ncbi:MAG: hypothetical protein KJP00_07460 [Bacteroidia bacterium]|nr:hypothetical protein [Bacteroidia bacterium]
MEIKSLQLFCQSVSRQKVFYQDLLGIAGSSTSESTLDLSFKENLLTFKESDNTCYYHFAFLIPTGSLESAIEYLESKSIDVLPFKGEKIVEFGTGRAIYFYDPEGNIAEFIERPSLNYPGKKEFEIGDVIKVNEIGLPCKATLSMSRRLMEDYGVVPVQKNLLSSEFRWIGDFNGVFIVTKIGRPWKPTKKPGIVNDFRIRFSTPKGVFDLSFQDNEVVENNSDK